MYYDATNENTDHWQKITVDDLKAHDACYFDYPCLMQEYLRGILPKTLPDLMRNYELPESDKYWLISHFGPMLTILADFNISQPNMELNDRNLHRYRCALMDIPIPEILDWFNKHGQSTNTCQD